MKLLLIQVCKAAKLEQSETIPLPPIHIVKHVKRTDHLSTGLHIDDNNFEALEIAFSKAGKFNDSSL